MIPFPIVVRELSVACRRPGFYRSRSAVGAGVILLVGIVLGIFFLAARSGGGFGVPPGRALFECLKWISFLAAGFAGLFLTSDCLSEEKRAGTLGLLFLTDLRGLDILLGKLATHSLRASFAFLAGFPIVGTCFLLGGVTGTEFTRLLATLLNTALSSLATGLLVSTVSRQTARTMSITFGLLLFSLGGWHLVGHSLAEVTGWDGFLSLVRLSPTDALLNAGASSPAGFWKPMAGVALCTLVTLSTSAWLLPRTWQVAAIRDRGWSFRRRQASTGLSTPHRGLLDRNPMVWLASRNHWSGRVLLVGTVIAAMVVLLSRIRTNPAVPGTPSIDTTPALIVFLLTLFSRLWITLHV